VVFIRLSVRPRRQAQSGRGVRCTEGVGVDIVWGCTVVAMVVAERSGS
jgi:hypothetical protein